MRKKLNLLIVSSVMILISYYSIRPPSVSRPGGGGSTLPLHFLAYFGLSAAFLLHLHDNRKGHITAVLASFCFGLLMELVQTQVPHRFFSYEDLLMNLLGASVVMLDHRSRMVTELIEKEDRLLEALEQRIL